MPDEDRPPLRTTDVLDRKDAEAHWIEEINDHTLGADNE
jgi:hypothetical protein